MLRRRASTWASLLAACQQAALRGQAEGAGTYPSRLATAGTWKACDAACSWACSWACSLQSPWPCSCPSSSPCWRCCAGAGGCGVRVHRKGEWKVAARRTLRYPLHLTMMMTTFAVAAGTGACRRASSGPATLVRKLFAAGRRKRRARKEGSWWHAQHSTRHPAPGQP